MMDQTIIAAYYNIKTGIRKEGILSYDVELMNFNLVEDRFRIYCMNKISSFKNVVELWINAVEPDKIMKIYDFIGETLEKDYKEERLFVEDILNWNNNPDTFLKDNFDIEEDLDFILNKFSLNFEESEKMR